MCIAHETGMVTQASAEVEPGDSTRPEAAKRIAILRESTTKRLFGCVRGGRSKRKSTSCR